MSTTAFFQIKTSHLWNCFKIKGNFLTTHFVSKRQSKIEQVRHLAGWLSNIDLISNIHLICSDGVRVGSPKPKPKNWKEPKLNNVYPSFPPILTNFQSFAALAQISLEWRMYKPIWYVILSILRLQIDLCTILWKLIWGIEIDKITFQTGVFILHTSEICATMG